MTLDTLFQNFFWLIFVAILVTFAWKMWKNGGLRGAVFGSKVERLVGEIAGEKMGMHGTAIKVHKLAGNDTSGTVGLELVARSFASYQMTPITLTPNAARELAALLNEAAQPRSTVSSYDPR